MQQIARKSLQTVIKLNIFKHEKQCLTLHKNKSICKHVHSHLQMQYCWFMDYPDYNM